MRRRDFIGVCGLLGLSGSIPSCTRAAIGRDQRFEGTILIVGSGAAGMSAGFLLEQHGVRYTILEASATYGGRMKSAENLADFSLPLGAEWLHVSGSVLQQLSSDPDVLENTDLAGYSGDEMVGHFANGRLTHSPLSDAFGGEFPDKKFVGSSWRGFFQEHVLPSVEANLRLNTPVVSISYRDDRVFVTDAAGMKHEADKVVVTVPLKMLQQGAITFDPELPRDRLMALQQAPVWGGLKAFFEFSEKFYPTFLTFPDSETASGQRMFFDASHAQRSSRNILGLFAVGEQAERYQRASGDEQRDLILRELDEVFGGEASRHYKQHIVQDWDLEPFVESAYLADNAPSHVAAAISQPIMSKLYFAGEAYAGGEDWGSVHSAVRSARVAIDKIMR